MADYYVVPVSPLLAVVLDDTGSIVLRVGETARATVSNIDDLVAKLHHVREVRNDREETQNAVGAKPYPGLPLPHPPRCPAGQYRHRYRQYERRRHGQRHPVIQRIAVNPTPPS
jgi:hypothetical protein